MITLEWFIKLIFTVKEGFSVKTSVKILKIKIDIKYRVQVLTQVTDLKNTQV